MKKNNNFLVAVATKDFGLIKHNKENGSIHFPFKVPEHFERLEIISENQQFFIDYPMFKMLGYQGVENRFTRVFVPNTDVLKSIKQTKNLKVHLQENIGHYINNKKINEPQSVIYFMGSNNFLEENMEHCDRLFLTVGNIVSDDSIIDKLDVKNVFRYFFRKRNELPSKFSSEELNTMVDKINQPNMIEKDVVEIAPNGMKIIKKVSVPKTDAIKHQIQSEYPEYKFFEYLK